MGEGVEKVHVGKLEVDSELRPEIVRGETPLLKLCVFEMRRGGVEVGGEGRRDVGVVLLGGRRRGRSDPCWRRSDRSIFVFLGGVCAVALRFAPQGRSTAPHIPIVEFVRSLEFRTIGVAFSDEATE